jgi:multiple antibiotic resistance protein
MNFAANSTLPEVTRVLAALALVCLITFVAFVTSDSLVRVLGQNAIKVVSRLMGLILAVIGVQMVIEGVRGAIAAS